eukprot:7407554-Karenia_brevis.AAC.1
MEQSHPWVEAIVLNSWGKDSWFMVADTDYEPQWVQLRQPSTYEWVLGNESSFRPILDLQQLGEPVFRTFENGEKGRPPELD